MVVRGDVGADATYRHMVVRGDIGAEATYRHDWVVVLLDLNGKLF